ncbi:MAG: hypothetical protein M1826_000508 [Phylliscum demangeonii]|nr:MAG: hypothetical protein M1826_000508 [Phylliscum demangeonii]
MASCQNVQLRRLSPFGRGRSWSRWSHPWKPGRARPFATALPPPPPPPPTTFRHKLETGPSLADFVSESAVGEADEAIRTAMVGPAGKQKEITRLPSWLKTPMPSGEQYKKIKSDLRGLNLHTVCEEARCPNISDCWAGSSKAAATATIMLMGDTCTRGCRFCSVKTSRAPPALDPHEPEHTAEALSRWGLGYVVLTSVDRDDLADGGARHFADTIARIKQKAPTMLVEALTGDFAGALDMVRRVARSGLDVYAHNLETVEALTPLVRDRRATFRQSLRVLDAAKRARHGLITKTSIMLGLGETEDQLWHALRELRAVEVDVVTFGQYMRPTKRHLNVVEYVTPAVFESWRRRALEMGFLYCASGPLVRSSYKAGEAFIENVLKKRAGAVSETAPAAAARPVTEGEAGMACFFKTLVDHTVTIELKNDISIRGTLKSVDQYLNVKLHDIEVLEEVKYPHLSSVKNIFIRGSVVRYIHLPGSAVDPALLEDATRRDIPDPKDPSPKNPPI